MNYKFGLSVEEVSSIVSDLYPELSTIDEITNAITNTAIEVWDIRAPRKEIMQFIRGIAEKIIC